MPSATNIMATAHTRRKIFLKNRNIGTIPVNAGTDMVKDVRTATNMLGFASDPARPIMGTNTSMQPATKYKDTVIGMNSPANR